MKEEIILKEICPYSMVPIDKAEIPQEALDIDNKVRSNLFAWNGQFSPQFIETLLEKYSSPSDTVFDPFLGSGTTSLKKEKDFASHCTECFGILYGQNI